MHWVVLGTVLLGNVEKFVETQFIHCPEDASSVQSLTFTVRKEVDYSNTALIVHSFGYFASTHPYEILRHLTKVCILVEQNSS